MSWTILTALVTLLMTLVFVYYKNAYNYWKKKNLPYIEPCFPFGNAPRNPFRRKKTVGFLIRSIYEQLKADGHKHAGAYVITKPVYIPIHPEYIKNVLAKDFNHFTDRGFYYNEKNDPLSANLASYKGNKWKHLRNKLSTTFTTSKMKMLLQCIVECGKKLEESVEKCFQNEKEMDAREILSCYTTDVIGSCAFGLECNSFQNEDSQFRTYGRKIFQDTNSFIYMIALGFACPSLLKYIQLKITSSEIAKFFINTIKKTVEFREKTNFIRKDFMQLLIDLKNNRNNQKEYETTEDQSITMEELAAQCFIFFLAGFETTASTLSFCIYELSVHPEIQKKVRKEIRSVLSRYENQITYNGLLEMKYTEQVIDETLRKYPPIPSLMRMCNEDYQVPGTDVVIEKGTPVVISVWGIHHDPEFYPEPEKFDPERFSDVNREKITPYTYIPFGEGPRICIGLRFGLNEIKIGLINMLNKYSYSLNQKTKLPFEMNRKAVIMSPVGGIWVNVEKVDSLD